MEPEQVIVYLDTQDFNNLLKADSELVKIREYLERAVYDRRITIGYSYPLIFELIRKYDEKHKNSRLEIARLIKGLCGSNAFPYPTDLITGAKFPNDGVWIPREALSDFAPEPLAKLLTESLRKSIVENPDLTRQQKRKAKSKGGFQELANQIRMPDLKKSDFPGVPVSEEFLSNRYLQKYLTGQLGKKQLSKEFSKWITDPEYTVQIWYEYSGKDNPLEPLVDNAYTSTTKALSEFHLYYE